MEMDREIDSIFQRRDQGIGSFRLEETCHIFDGDDIRTGILHLFRKVSVVFQRVLLAVRIHDIAGVAEAGFSELFFLADFVDGDGHMAELVQAVEDTEYIDTIVSRLINEVTDNIFRIVGIADGIRTAGQHLEEDVRCSFSHLTKAFPRAFIKETISHVEGRAAPALDGPVADFVELVAGGQHLVGAHSGGSLRLVRVAENGFRNIQGFLFHILK